MDEQKKVSIVFTDRELSLFARLSGDNNPIHTDADYSRKSPYGQKIVFGVLSILACLKLITDEKFFFPSEIQVDFEKPVFLSEEYTAIIEEETDSMLCIRFGVQNMTSIRIRLFNNKKENIYTENFNTTSKNITNLNKPREYKDEDFLSSNIIEKGYQIDCELIEELIESILDVNIGISKNLIKILCLTSYIIGMELPGKRALFSKLRLELNNNVLDNYACIYFSASQQHYDQYYRMTEIDLKVGYENCLIAHGTLNAFIHKNITRVPLEVFSQKLNRNKELKGKVGLIIGGSRGLGAAFAQALALKGCTIILNYHKSAAEAVALKDEINEMSPSLCHLYQGDTSNPEVCDSLNEFIEKNFNRLDYIILSAFLPPLSKMQRESYISKNEMLFQQPIIALSDLLKESKGMIIGISSIFVKNGPKELDHYIYAKKALEAYLQHMAKENQDNLFMIVRPPKLLTDMNNTPSGWINSISPEIVAAKVIDSLDEKLSAFKNNQNICIIENFDDTKSINITATFTANPVLKCLDFWAKEWQWKLKTNFSPYNQILQDLFNIESALHSNVIGLNVILVRFEDWYRFKAEKEEFELFIKAPIFTNIIKEFYENYLEELINALKFYNNYHQGRTLFILCPNSPSFYKSRQWEQLFENMEARLNTEIDRLTGIDLVNSEAYHKLYEVQNIFDNTSNMLGHIPFTQDYYAYLGTLVIRQYFSIIRRKYKVIVLDCDNTLWKGIVGEDGTYGIKINNLFEAWQKTLVEMSEKGYLLCLCSKNNSEDVIDVFEKNSFMKLKRDHIVECRINWKNKSENLFDLAKSLNVGIDSFIFIDDNIVECTEVRINCPEVLTLLWPSNEKEAWQFINHIWALDHFGEITKEDSQRTLFYKANTNREELKLSSASYHDFLENLNLSVKILPLSNNFINRASQLTNRTNQFNFNPIKRDEKEILGIFNDNSYKIMKVEVDDKFGSYGFVGLMICKKAETFLRVDSFLLSCRVLGRGVKYKMLQQIGKIANELQLAEVVFVFLKTEKNHAAYQFIEKLANNLKGVERLEIKENSIEYRIPVEEINNYDFTPTKQIGDEINEEHKLKCSEQDSLVSLRELEKKLEYIGKNLSNQKQIWSFLDKGEFLKSTNKGKSDTKNLCIEENIKNVICKVTNFERADINFSMPIEDFNFESMKKIEISSELIRQYPQLSPTFLFEYPNLESVAQYLKHQSSYKQSDNEFMVKHVMNTSNEDDIAIIGINALLPQSKTKQELWENLVNGNSCITEIPNNRWDVGDFYSPNSSAIGKSHCKWGGFLDDVECFDNTFFGISPREAEGMDPQQRLFLEMVWGLIEDAGYKSEDLSRKTGVFVGVIAGDFGFYLNQAVQHGFSPYRWGDYYQIANRISYFFNFKGPSIAIDTACSSSGTALYFACQSIRTNECQTAIVGGVNLILHPSRYIQYTKMGLLTPEDKCRPFSADAKGTIMGEGVGSLLLKSLKEAQKDGDHIYGIIKSCAINSGGKTNGFTVPNPKAHSNLIREALYKAKVESTTINYIEAHGTGTIVGDPIEINGIADAFSWNEATGHKESQCAIGTVKSNIGHLESAAAVAGIIKILLQMKYQKLVPSINASPLNSLIDIKEKYCKVQQELTNWDPVTLNIENERITYPRRAGISSFGAGGSNFHAILEEYPEDMEKLPQNNKPNLIIFSAKREKALLEMAKNLKDYIRFEQKHIGIKEDKQFFNRLAYTLQVGRSVFQHRLVIIADSLDDLTTKLENFLSTGIHDEFIESGVCEIDKHTLNWNDEEIEREYFKSLYNCGSLKKLAYLWLKGVVIDWGYFYDNPKPVRIPLPSYPFEQKIFPLKKIIDANKNRKLYEKINSPLLKSDLYQLVTGVKQFPFLIDHQVKNTIIIPGAFSLSLMLTCLMNEFKFESFKVSDITFRKALLMDKNSEHLTQVAIDLKGKTNAIEVYFDEIDSKTGDKEWSLYTKGQFDGILQNNDYYIDIISLQSQCNTHLSKEEFYQKGIEKGFLWGPQFQWIKQVWLAENEVLAKIVFKNSYEEQFAFPPSVLDACLQPFIFAMEKHCMMLGIEDTYIPFSIEELKIYKKPPEEIYTYINFNYSGEVHKEYFIADCKITDLKGKILCEITGLRFKQVQHSLFNQSDDISNYLYKIYWETLNRKKWSLAIENVQSVIIDLSYSSNSFRELKDILIESYNSCEYLDERNGLTAKMNTNDDFTDGFSNLCISTLAKCVILFYDGSKDLALFEEVGFDTLYKHSILRCFQLLKVIASSNEGQPFNIILITQNSQNVTAGDVSSPIGSALQGFAKVLNSENSNVHVRCVDFSINTLQNHLVEREHLHNWCQLLLSGMSENNKSGYEELAIVENMFFRKRLVKVENLKNSEVMPILKHNRTYMIIGGAGGLGFELSVHLTKIWKSTLIWVGRKTQKEVQEKISEIESVGGKILYIEADAKDYGKLEKSFARVKEMLPPINGVFHAAIVLKDSMFANMKEADLAEVFDTKAKTMMNILKLLDGQRLDFIASFSSECSFRGSPAQANYVAGCRFLDSYLISLSNCKNIPVKIINWGYWGETGIVATPEFQKRLESIGLLPFKNTEGMDITEKIFSLNYPQLLAIKSTPIYAEKVGIYANEVIQTANHDYYPLKDGFDEKKSTLKSNNAIIVQKDEAYGQSMAETLEKMPLTQKTQYLEEMLKDQLKRILLITEDEYISNTTGFQDIGVDSLYAVQFRDSLSIITNQKLSTTIIYDYPNIQSLAAYILKNINHNAALAEAATVIEVQKVPIAEVSLEDASLWQKNTDLIAEYVTSMPEDEAVKELMKELKN